MQDGFVGDIGDYVKYALLRAIRGNSRLGVAWYLHPNALGGAGKYTCYLHEPEKWCHLDPPLFDALKRLVDGRNRSVQAVMDSEILGPSSMTDFSLTPLDFGSTKDRDRAEWRKSWFESVQKDPEKSSFVFADPDNGLIHDDRFSPGVARQLHGIPLSEAKALTADRAGVIYHHNTRFTGGHLREIQYWMGLLPGCTHAFYFRPRSPRTFFVINPEEAMRSSLLEFGKNWSEHGCLLDQKGCRCLLHGPSDQCIVNK